jgi:hypothetical protein
MTETSVGGQPPRAPLPWRDAPPVWFVGAGLLVAVALLEWSILTEPASQFPWGIFAPYALLLEYRLVLGLRRRLPLGERWWLVVAVFALALPIGQMLWVLATGRVRFWEFADGVGLGLVAIIVTVVATRFFIRKDDQPPRPPRPAASDEAKP